MTHAEQVQYITDHALTMPVKRIARHIGRTQTFVRSEIRRQGIVIPQHIIEQRRRDSWYKPGTPPANKGVPREEWMSPEMIEKVKKTQFCKGHIPANTLHDYAVSRRRDTSGRDYYYIRLGLGRWELLHRYVWSLYHGEIPEGYNVQFYDGDSLNVDIDNLYIITRSQQSQINIAGGNKLPHEARETILLINKLKRKIKHYEKQNNRPQ